MPLQHDNARPHTIAAASAVIQNIRFEVAPCPPFSQNLALSAFWLIAALKYHLKGVHFTCYEEVQTARENDLENSLKIYTLMGSKNLFNAGGVVLN
jgi:hypothetical protein